MRAADSFKSELEFYGPILYIYCTPEMCLKETCAHLYVHNFILGYY